MVQKSETRRGRPRAYDPDAALVQAMGAFWDAGFAATSLDDLSAATGMNRPSLYGAFGDKRAIYREAFERYMANARVAMGEALGGDRPLRVSIRRVYDGALALYFSGGKGARGCFMIGTTVTECVTDPELREALRAGLRELDGAFEARFATAVAAGELAPTTDPATLARLASGFLYFLAIRSRAGEKRAVLDKAADAAVDFLCGPPAPAARRRGR